MILTPREEGYFAANQGLSEDANPFRRGTEAFYEWEDGFDCFWSQNPN